jgi:hypothetical protein
LEDEPVTRFSSVVAIVSVAVFAAACADGTTAIPSSSLRPTGHISAAGNPPPPPLTGRGDGELLPDDFSDEFSSAASVGATTNGSGKSALPSCTLPGTVDLDYAFDYLINKQDNNAFVHLDPDNQKQITIHQHGDKLDAHGTIVGTGFTFAIGDVTDGSIIGEGGGVVGSFFLRVTGIVTLANGNKCQAAAILEGDFGGSN